MKTELAPLFPSAERRPEPVMAHVLFADIVGYSKLTADEQSRALQRFQHAVRNTAEFQRAQTDDGFVRNPTGDGMALVFFDETFAPVRCAMELATALLGSGIGVRVGLHSGMVYRVQDINGKPNVVGEAINTAQRVMDCGDAGHILLSATQAQFLGSFNAWSAHLADLGLAKVKHGVMVHLFNLTKEGVGNASVPSKLAEARPEIIPAATPVSVGAPAREPAQPSRVEASVAILYKRGAPDDECLLKVLDEGLRRAGCKVFIDLRIKIGLDWAQKIEQELRNADAVIPLLSPSSVDSEMLALELQIAEDAAQRGDGKPKLLPVRVNWDGPLPPNVATVMDRYQYSLWAGPQDNESIVAELLEALTRPADEEQPIRNRQLEAPGGAVPLDSRFYIERQSDEQFHSALRRRDSIVLVEGARQMGKTSLLSRGLQQARKSGDGVVFTDFQKLNAGDMLSIDAFYKTLGTALADQLDLMVYPEDVWRAVRGPNQNFERYLRSEVLGKVPGKLVWGMDEVDRLFTCPFGSEVFGLFRSWHNARATDPDGPWSRLTQVIAYATEAHLFITDLNQSPFNVGTRIQMRDFTLAETAAANRSYGEPIKAGGDVESFHGLLGGQPYLIRRGLHELATRSFSLPELLSKASEPDGPFGDHLRRFLVLLSCDEGLLAAVREYLAAKKAPSPKLFQRLRAAGLLQGDQAGATEFRCEIYERYLRRSLL
jgi:class 3 adenylate cyclase